MDNATPTPTENTSPYEGGLGPEFEALLHRIDAREHAEYVRGFKAMMLAPTLSLYHSLMSGERIPWQQLNPFQAERFGLRHRRGDGRYGLDDFHDVRESAPGSPS